ncbi:hypothetical protein EDC14_10401 [Hydrogenispora ethanolica]|uniref:WxcM-like protein n=1 Tax=Hydrogenispora ethanolica TaxID=1082276 RepID=A0A4V2QC45_HYDET|nr:hypothetical protein [Hydrogenispora ethanolica]TCL58787.1 hypothetical protein EDC14_10401 [Hydrogenispora ethanolica]
MSIPEHLLEIREYTGPGYLPVIDFQSWRVAILRHCDDLLPARITKMQRHDQTDEVFLLLQGRCLLFLGDGKATIGEVFAQELEPLKLYNVKRSAWHTHTLSPDAMVLIVENQTTGSANSPEYPLNEPQRQFLVDRSAGLYPSA